MSAAARGGASPSPAARTGQSFAPNGARSSAAALACHAQRSISCRSVPRDTSVQASVTDWRRGALKGSPESQQERMSARPILADSTRPNDASGHRRSGPSGRLRRSSSAPSNVPGVQ